MKWWELGALVAFVLVIAYSAAVATTGRSGLTWLDQYLIPDQEPGLIERGVP